MASKRRKKKKDSFDLGTKKFHCHSCHYDFEVEWQTIFDIQECTHGYVGYDVGDVYISCPKCDLIIRDDDDDYEDEKRFIESLHESF